MRTTLLVVALVAVLSASRHLRAEDEPAPATFPASWQGHWKGPSVAAPFGRAKTEFPMELRIAPLEGREAWTWEIVYGEGEKRQVRPYELLPVEGEPGHFVVDEKNSILIDAWFQDEAVCTRFWVSNSVIDARYERDGEKMVVTLTTFGEKPARMSGGVKRVPPVASYALRAVQRAVLTRTK